MEVNYTLYKNINIQKWDTCIAQSLTPSIYSTALYLNTMAPQWDALIVGEYEYIMPIIFKIKYGIKYCYQPAFLPHIGIFSSKIISKSIFQNFLSCLSSKIVFAEISFLHPINFLEQSPKFKCNLQTNFTLSLLQTYQIIHKNYLPSFTKSLRRLQKHNLQYCVGTSVNEVFNLYKKLYVNKIQSLSLKDLQSFKKLCDTLLLQKKIIIKIVRDNNQNLLAAVLLLVYKNKLYNILSCINSEGKKLEANYFLYDCILKEFANKPYIFDFEGSEIIGVANFYKKMNPINEPTFQVKYNNLPKILKFFKQ